MITRYCIPPNMNPIVFTPPASPLESNEVRINLATVGNCVISAQFPYLERLKNMNVPLATSEHKFPRVKTQEYLEVSYASDAGVQVDVEAIKKAVMSLYI